MENIGINVNSTKDKDDKILKAIIETIKETFTESNIEIYKDSIGLDNEKSRKLDILITLGGDGTILRSARAVSKFSIPILGVNIGNLGFLAGVECKQFKEAVKKLKNGSYNVEERAMLKCIALNSDKNIEFNSLNDIVISKGTLSRIVRYDISVDNKFYTSFNADGIIIATPTGSTAYSLSAGGPILYPNLSLMEITAICPHAPGMRTLVVDAKSKVDVAIERGNESVFLTVDGQESLELDEITNVSISSSDYKCKVIRIEDYDYFDILRKKIIFRTRDCER
jgi:NAD+ kinase